MTAGNRTTIRLGALALCFLLGGVAYAQAPKPPAAPPPKPLLYGTPITLEQAQLVMAAANAEAKKRGVDDTIAIVEPTGELVMYQKATTGQYAAYEFAVGKARTAARYRRETKVLYDQLKAGDMTVLNYPDAISAGGGGAPIIVGGKIIGAIGLTGGADEFVVAAGVNALK